MARPGKRGIDYYPMDVNFLNDDKIQLLLAEHGIEGWGILSALWSKIYSEGYFYLWTEREQLLFSSRVNVDKNLLNVNINSALRWELFDPGIYRRYKVLTSKAIQINYFAAMKRRGKVLIQAEYLLVKPPADANLEFLPPIEDEKQLLLTNTELLHTKTELLLTKTPQKKREEKRREREETGVFVNKNSFSDFSDSREEKKNSLTLSDDFIKFKTWVHLTPENVLRYLATIGTDGLGYYIGQVDDHLDKNASLREGEHSRYFDKFLREDKRHKRGIYSNGSSVHGLKRANSTVLSEFARRANTDPENFVNSISALLSSIPAPAEEGAIQ